VRQLLLIDIWQSSSSAFISVLHQSFLMYSVTLLKFIVTVTDDVR